ncbi:TPA: hypothetical protein DD449_01160 [Candidatus Berkelbacteria bacterium]|uniref:Putative peptidase, dipeptidase E n=1 Tax=Berkelbacteria bacterium GW2011_GWE1_39_12 TaxID=1618337 RepID=A0A0G4B6J4_9BACT|nr:MAG: putative peptidase, dipeptidase E [Berkelbacteria bacterium GW2011_GWE1_39_12]HBO60281.1 hypothetical protein [Candidatus Berkelbacteria bacterium]
MKIFLTSSAYQVMDKIVSELPMKPSELKVVFIPTAGDPYDDDRPWQKADHDKLSELGFVVTDFDLKEKTESDVRDILGKVDVIFVAGGNTFYLLEKARESGFEKVIKELNDSDKIYIGSSAGSCIAGPDLEPIAPIDDPEKANLDNTKAFGLVDFVVLPHHGNPKYDILHEKVIKEFGNKYEIKTITNEQTIAINDKEN